MYQVLLALQYIGIIVCVLVLAYVYTQRPGRLHELLLLLMHSVVINHIGYTLEMLATDQKSAVTAVKIIYLGKPYIIFSVFLLIMLYCRIRLPRWLVGMMSAFHLFISALVFTCEKHTLYYSSIDYVQDGLFPHLVLGHGIVYQIYMIIMMLDLILMVAVITWRLVHTRTKEGKSRLIGLLMMTIVSFSGFFLFLSGVTKGYDITAVTYVLSTLILIYTLVKYDLSDVLVVAKDMIIDDFVDGVLVVDEKEKPIYRNRQFGQICSDLGDSTDTTVKRVMELYTGGEKLRTSEHIFEIHEKDMIQDEVCIGRVYLINDVTESYQYMAKLEEQKELADQANQAKTDFLARMSHEIRTPINSVLGMNEMILRESTEPAIKKYGMDVKTSANSLLSIINDILDLSKIESGKMEILPVEYELGSLLNDLVNMIFVRAKEKGLKIEVLVEETLPARLYGDDVRIRQILTNLLTNAVKYTPEGTVTLSVSGKIVDSRAFMHFEVKDTGIGMKEESLPDLFVSFQRIEESRNRNIEGTGLGMSIVQNLLDKMGSRLEVESVYGEGSTFSFDLVQTVRSDTCIGDFEEEIQKIWEEYSYQTSFTAPKAKVLVIDDNDINRSVFRNLLKKTLVQVTDADSGEKCLELVSREHFDVIFMDDMMPGMNGVETLHRMKQQEENMCRDVPVIILTANAVTGAKEQYIKNGFQDFLSKPIIPERLELMLQGYLPEDYVEQELETGGSAEGERKTQPSGFEELPKLEEFDWEYARRHFPAVELLEETLRSIYLSLGPDMEKLDALMENIQEPHHLEDYRIQVHALKSTMASVGALLLSKLARLLEAAAQEQDIKKLSLLHPVLLEEMEKHRERLKPLADLGQEARQEASQLDDDGWEQLLSELKGALEDWDYDTADALVDQAGTYRYEDSMQELLDALKSQVYNLQAKEAIQTIEEMMTTANR